MQEEEEKLRVSAAVPPRKRRLTGHTSTSAAGHIWHITLWLGVTCCVVYSMRYIVTEGPLGGITRGNVTQHKENFMNEEDCNYWELYMLVRFLVSQFQPSNVSGWHTYSLRDELFIYCYAGSCGVVSHDIQQEEEEEEVTEEGAKVIFSSSSLIVIRLVGYCDWGSKRRGVGFDKVGKSLVWNCIKNNKLKS